MRAWSGEGPGDVDIMGPTVPHTISGKLSTPSLKNGNDARGTGYLVSVGSRSTRFRKKHGRKILDWMVYTLLAVITIMFMVMTVLYLKELHRRYIGHCDSKECIRTAADLAYSIDWSADPCDDFYQFVCGNWPKQHPNTDSLIAHDWFHEHRSRITGKVKEFLKNNSTENLSKPTRQAKEMYAACMDEAKTDELGLTPIFEILESLGLPPYPTYLNATSAFDYSTYDFDWVHTVIKFKTFLATDVLYGFDVISDDINSTVPIMIVGSPETITPFPSNLYLERYIRMVRKEAIKKNRKTPPSEDYLQFNDIFQDTALEEDEYSKIEKYFTMYMLAVMKVIFQQSDGPKLTQLNDSEIEENMKLALKEYINFETDLYEFTDFSNMTNESTESNLLYPKYTIEEIQKQTNAYVEAAGGEVKEFWRPYIAAILDISDAKVDLDKVQIVVSERDMMYIGMVSAFLSQSSIAVIELFLWIQIVDILVPHTSCDMRDLQYKYSRKISGAETSVARSSQCAVLTHDLLGMAVGQAIIDEDFLTETKPKVEFMLHGLKVVLSASVERSKWMDEFTKVKIIDKIYKMESFIGYPTWILDNDTMEEYYKGIEINPDKHLFNMINIVQVTLKNHLNLLNGVYTFKWTTPPTEVNAFHSYTANAITVPFAMIQYPFYGLGLEALNYGALGTILGHEITHGFDDNGREFDAQGNLMKSWTEKSIDSFKNVSECFVNQYSNLYEPLVGEYVDGKKTLSENLADNGGLQQAFSAYQRYVKKNGPEKKLVGFDNMTSEQLFYLSYANIWCGRHTKQSMKYDLRDPHAPHNARLWGALMNHKEFAASWKCSKKTKMNPDRDRCFLF